jgi:hypothetical protein
MGFCTLEVQIAETLQGVAGRQKNIGSTRPNLAVTEVCPIDMGIPITELIQSFTGGHRTRVNHSFSPVPCARWALARLVTRPSRRPRLPLRRHPGTMLRNFPQVASLNWPRSWGSLDQLRNFPQGANRC